MCGIAGYLTLDNSEINPEILRNMAASLRHRGPDGEGIRIIGPVGLAHRRLSIIDLSSGDQPMANEDDSIWIIFNGEIYNYLELNQELEDRGHKFRTKSDTETILHLYEEKGMDCVSFLRGMFAFALYDQRNNLLMLARDRFGIKPLYYYYDEEKLIFGSEIKSLLQHPSIKTELDSIAVSDFFTYLYVPGPRSIFRHIQKLEPATILTVQNGALNLTHYWQPSFDQGQEIPISEEEWIERMEHVLRESVRLHMRSDVPYGALLSGGIDSSTIVALMAEESDRPIRTYSIGFDEQEYSELIYAREVARRFGTDHHECILRPDGLSVLPDLVTQFDEPFADSSALPCFHIAQLVSEDVKVCLTGDGGDETFGGYDAYQVALRLQLFNVIPQQLRQFLVNPILAVYPRWWLGKGILSFLPLTFEDRYTEIMCGFNNFEKERILTEDFVSSLNGYNSYQLFRSLFAQSKRWDILSQMQYVDFKTYLPDDIEVKIDRTSMFHSLELRVPFLDHIVMDLASQMPRSLKIRNGQGKYLLRKIMQPFLPPKILSRAKKGFSVPLKHWLGREFGKFAEEVFRDPVTRQRNILDVKGLLSLLYDEEYGPLWFLNYGAASTLMLLLWCGLLVGKKPLESYTPLGRSLLWPWPKRL